MNNHETIPSCLSFLWHDVSTICIGKLVGLTVFFHFKYFPETVAFRLLML